MAENENKATEIVGEKPETTPTAVTRTAEDYEAEIARLKAANSKASADVSRYKQELKTRMTAEEAAEAERKERDAQMAAELAGYKERERLASNKSRLMEAGYDAPTAESMAKSVAENVDDSFFSAQKAYLDAYKRKIETDFINKQPNLAQGAPLSTADAAEKGDAQLRKYFGLK